VTISFEIYQVTSYRTDITQKLAQNKRRGHHHITPAVAVFFKNHIGFCCPKIVALGSVTQTENGIRQKCRSNDIRHISVHGRFTDTKTKICSSATNVLVF
jgi:hypothetical protein